MKKKILSAVMALALVFGSAAALPQGVFTEGTSITVAAAGTTLMSGDFKFVLQDNGTAKITGYTGKAATLYIPSTLGGKRVTSIGQNAFSLSTTLKSVTIPESITEIGYSAFLQCSKLTSVKFGQKLKKIDMYAFAQTGLSSVSIPASVMSIGKYAFEECQSLKTVTINSGVSKTIENYAFTGCKALNSLDLGTTVSAIGSFAFEKCTALTSVTVPDSVKSINQRAFKDCTKLASVNLGNGVKTISNGAFIGCEALKTVKFGTALESIGNSAFESCTSLTSVVLMPSTKSIGESAFGGCSAMTAAVLPGVETIGPKAFWYCAKLSDVYFGENSIRAIGENAFVNCANIKKIGIPSNVTEIRAHAFGYGYKDGKYGKAKEFTIYGETNSQAQKYAANNKFTFVSTASHTHKNKTITVPYSCTTDGYQITICQVCGKMTKSNAAIAAGHKGTDWKTTAFNVSAKTSTQTGRCLVCGAELTRTFSDAITRLAGAGRYATAAKISKKAFPDGANTVVLAYGLNYADALAGVPLAKAKGAPILLTGKDSLPKETLDEIRRLKAQSVIILGGEGVIGKQIQTELVKSGIKAGNIKRVFGKTRFGTATAIAEKLNEKPTDIFFVYGLNYADALSVSTVAALKNAPVIYLTTKGDLNADTAKYLAQLKTKKCVKNAYVIGGEGVISNDMMSKAGKALGVTPTRVFGANRFETCIAVNEKFAGVLNGTSICVATGMDFPDALAGGVFAALNRAPLFLINGKVKTPSLNNRQKAYLEEKAPNKITIFGGEGVVPDKHIEEIAKYSV